MSLPASHARAPGVLIRLASAAWVLAITQGRGVEVPPQLTVLAWLIGLMAISEMVRCGVHLAVLAVVAMSHSSQAAPRAGKISQEAPI